ncbi:MAG: PqqD family protein [Chlorobi bacterium]|nr:PqqD family protein [Chlorobiota bacterium]
MKERYFIRKDGFVEKKIGDELILVPLADSVAKMNEVITLNEIGAFIYEKVRTKTAFSVLKQEIINTYDVNADIAEKDLNDFIRKAIEKDIIIERN